jgi:hypothetical protein
VEAEIIALTHCFWELFPVMDIVAQIGEVVGMETKELVSMPISIHEYNARALVLAEAIPPQFTP